MAKNRRNDRFDDYDDEWGRFDDQQDRKRNKHKPRRGSKRAWYDDVNTSDPDYGFTENDYDFG